ncbi:hypothetical protein [Rubinisphaera italica]|uniref:PPi-type phosphoenolpyruvate carboxykinase lobe 2 domain-containing protein n=1 Tax=Rubinisphaera italica TaxID=2527969 RepID=A0A5C5XBP3_9PLAN|nr:hypothetical protein [Rubinisphaera italica]TWT59342.1 hypothetical protein Pan54_00430 [Rubinisphaera italica]
MPTDSNKFINLFGLDQERSLGFLKESTDREEYERRLVTHANLQLKASGLPCVPATADEQIFDISESLLENYREKNRLLRSSPIPVDQRIENYLDRYFASLNLEIPLRLPDQTLTLERHGMGRALSLPANGNFYKNDLVNSYRVKNGVLHNPRHDRRTTKGTFHVAEGGLPISGDKKAVPKLVFANLFQVAMNPPQEFLELPFTADAPDKAHTFVSLYLRPLIAPQVPGYGTHKSMEIRFFAPGSLVSNLDFVESIFGNAGDPLLPDNDAGLDVEHWSGHTGCVVLAPQMLSCTKKELGLPHYDDATARQRRDSMCWKEESELYNDGQPFKITCRDKSGVVITLIADNYFGYCKKEVKTQISYATNLYGNTEEEHAGGAIAFRSYSLGEKFQAKSMQYNAQSFEDVVRRYSDFIDVKPEGYGIDKNFPNLIYIPENALAMLTAQSISWNKDGNKHEIPLLPGQVYMTPSGYQIRMEKHPHAPSWRLIGTVAEGTFCHKPCTVSGGGKSEISKSLVDYMHYGPLFVSNLDQDFKRIQEILDKADFQSRWREDYSGQPDYKDRVSRPIFGPQRSLGSVIKLLTPSADYNDDYNKWLTSIPDYLLSLLFIIKRFEEEHWEDNWMEPFGVDLVNGQPGHELKFRDRTLVGTYLRVGFLGPRKWRTFKLRQDFSPANKIQTEDDISASMVVPASQLKNLSKSENQDSLKFLINCEYRLFQRPDEAIHRGFDKQAEADLAGMRNFISNFAPLTREDILQMAEKVVDFDAFSKPMQELLTSMIEDEDSEYVVCSANPRKIGEANSKNPRYLQARPDMSNVFPSYVAERGLRLHRTIPSDEAVPFPVHGVLMGRRNNPPDKEAGIRSLAVYNPIHYQELPEMFMDLICSLTGKSPSTTGFGSEGALTKGPFNMLRFAADLNAALVSYLLTGLKGFSTAAGHIGPEVQVDHDISLLVPEVWSRLEPHEQDPAYLLKEGSLEKLDDVEFNGEKIELSRLGYRMTRRFVRNYFGRIFDHPLSVFDDKILKPETQDPESFYDGVKYICEAHRQVAEQYLVDGTYDQLCPPLQSLVKIMAHGSDDGVTVQDEEFRKQFTRENLIESDWYQERLKAKQVVDLKLMRRHQEYLEKWSQQPDAVQLSERMQIEDRKAWVESKITEIKSEEYLDSLTGTLGVQPNWGDE